MYPMGLSHPPSVRPFVRAAIVCRVLVHCTTHPIHLFFFFFYSKMRVGLTSRSFKYLIPRILVIGHTLFDDLHSARGGGK